MATSIPGIWHRCGGFCFEQPSLCSRNRFLTCTTCKTLLLPSKPSPYMALAKYLYCTYNCIHRYHCMSVHVSKRFIRILQSDRRHPNVRSCTNPLTVFPYPHPLRYCAIKSRGWHASYFKAASGHLPNSNQPHSAKVYCLRFRQEKL